MVVHESGRCGDEVQGAHRGAGDTVPIKRRRGHALRGDNQVQLCKSPDIRFAKSGL